MHNFRRIQDGATLFASKQERKKYVAKITLDTVYYNMLLIHSTFVLEQLTTDFFIKKINNL